MDRTRRLSSVFKDFANFNQYFLGLKFKDLFPPFERLTGAPDGFPSKHSLQLRPAPVVPVITTGRNTRLGIRETRRFRIAITKTFANFAFVFLFIQRTDFPLWLT